MDESIRNYRIANLLDMWEWCSRTLHVKWQRKRRHRNGCLMGIAFALSKDTFVSPIELPATYHVRPVPLLDKAALLELWRTQPLILLELCLGVFTKDSPLREPLDQVRFRYQDNAQLDDVTKKMRSREKRFQGDWQADGHHPETEFSVLKRGTAPLLAEMAILIASEPKTVDQLAREVLAQGPWKSGELPATDFIRKTPENLLNRTTRLRLWQAAQDVRILPLDEEAALDALCTALHKKITPAIKAAIESEGYSVKQVVDDMVNFDMHKKREEIG